MTNVIETFISYVSKYDRDKWYLDFKSPFSMICIIVATILLRMGVNVPDVEQVILWQFLIRNDLRDYWQRLNYGG